MGEKKRRLAAQQARPDRHDGRLIAQAFQALEVGDRRRRRERVRLAADGAADRRRRAARGRRPRTAAWGDATGRGTAVARHRAESPRRGVSLPPCHRLPASRPAGSRHRSAPNCASARSRARRSAFESRQPPAGVSGQRRRVARASLAHSRSVATTRTPSTGSERPSSRSGTWMLPVPASSGRWCWIRRFTRPGTTSRGPGWNGRRASNGLPVPRCLRPRRSRTRSSAWRASSPRCSSPGTFRRIGCSSRIASGISTCDIPSIRAFATRCFKRSTTRRSTRRAWCGRS